MYSEKFQALGGIYLRAIKALTSALESVKFPEGKWEKVKRTHINSRSSLEAFSFNDGLSGSRNQSRVGKYEEMVWEEADEDWTDVKGFDWFKAYLTTLPHCVSENEIQGLWDELEASLKGESVKVETPIVIVLATKV
ncbi:hypothetical protein GQX73_g2177 [Xylaria multiplex]|uniref:Uncharacterized protein n=1 Tax=Xylaria multiplex TaxID=323545 RepID=A0A7C8MYK7_9PEZI|nr:hypothetical protein GQX73_g2177 [Xylaria multiplex]